MQLYYCIESKKSGNEWLSGQRINCFQCAATFTAFRYYDAGDYNGNGKLVTRHFFDNWGRTVNVLTMNPEVTDVLGVSLGAYTKNEANSRRNNRLTNAASAGIQSINLLQNADMEYLEAGKPDEFYGWTKHGNGSSAPRVDSGSGTLVKPYLGNYMMKLFQWNRTDGEHSVQQSVYLEKDQTYVFSAYVNTACTDAFGPDGGVYLSFLQGTSLKAKSRVINYKTGLSVDGGWERIELAFTPAASGSYQVAANVYNIGAIAVFDNFQLEKILDTGAPDLSSTGSKAGTASAYNLIQSGSFEFPNSANGIGDRSNVNRWWIYNTGEACPVLQSADFPAEPHSGRFSLTFLPNTSRKQRATQTISVNSSSNKTYILSGWGFMPPSNLQDSKELEGDNANDCRFFGLIAKVSYSDGSTPDYHYVSFNGDINMWQYASGIVVPKQENKTVSTITVSACLDHCANRAYMDDISLIQEPVQTYLYDDNGNLTSATNSEGKTSTEMDSRERLTEYTAINGVQYTLSYSGDSRDPAAITSDGVKTSYSYDAAGNVNTTMVKPTGGGSYFWSKNEYDATKNFCVKSADINAANFESSYDVPTGRLTQSKNPNGKTTRYYYNYKKGSPDYTNYSDNSGYLYYDYYDDGQIRQLNRKSYDNGSLKRQSYHFSYDAWGNTTEIQVGKATSNRASTLSVASTLATYSYDSTGKMTRMNYPSGQYVTYGYDKLDRLVQEVYYNSDGSVQAEYQYIYNADGQLAKQQAIRNGAVVESYHFEYDSLGRLIRSREENGSSNVQRTEHLYDTKNRLTTQSWTMGSKSFYENYYYRPSDGALNRVTEATGDTVSFGYDALKRVTTVTTKNYANKVLLTQSNTYQNFETINGETRTSTRLSTYTVKGANNQTLVGNRYSYDANGNITKIEEANSSGYRVAAEYAYDSLNQLTKETRYTYSGTSTTATDTTVVDYVIDTAGNLRSVTTTVNGTQTDQIIYTYGNTAWADKLTAVTVNGTKKTISYADTLNPKNWYNGTSYTNLTWTQGRRLSSLKKGNQTYSYEYDMSGVRSAKVVNGERHEYVTQNGRVVRDYVTYAGTDTFVRCTDFFYDEAGRPFAMRCYYDSTLTGADTFHYVLNAQGDVVQIIYQGETVYAEYSYDAWGNITSIKGSSSGNMYYANLNPLRYRGYYYDTETGFYYLQSRYYDPAVKRFLNADSYGSTGQGFLGYNMFAYCENEPVRFADFSGMDRIAVIYDDTFTFHNALGLGGLCFTFSIIQEYLFDDVAVYSYNNADEFKECWNSLSGHYDKIIVFGHGSSNAPAIWFQNTDSYLGLGSRCKDPITSLKSVSSEDMELYICYAAKTFPDQSPQSIARFFANLTGAKVQATAGIVHFFPLIKFTATWLDDDFPWVQVLPYSMEPQKTYNPTKEALC